MLCTCNQRCQSRAGKNVGTESIIILRILRILHSVIWLGVGGGGSIESLKNLGVAVSNVCCEGSGKTEGHCGKLCQLNKGRECINVIVL